MSRNPLRTVEAPIPSRDGHLAVDNVERTRPGPRVEASLETRLDAMSDSPVRPLLPIK